MTESSNRPHSGLRRRSRQRWKPLYLNGQKPPEIGPSHEPVQSLRRKRLIFNCLRLIRRRPRKVIRYFPVFLVFLRRMERSHYLGISYAVHFLSCRRERAATDTDFSGLNLSSKSINAVAQRCRHFFSRPRKIFPRLPTTPNHATSLHARLGRSNIAPEVLALAGESR